MVEAVSIWTKTRIVAVTLTLILISSMSISGVAINSGAIYTKSTQAGVSPQNPDRQVVANVTLISGQTVTIIENGNQTLYRVTPRNATMYRINTQHGIYIFPKGVNFSKFHPIFFNITFLRQQGWTNNATSAIPVIVRKDNDVSGFSASLNNTLGTVKGYTFRRSLPRADAASINISKANAQTIYRRLKSSTDIKRIYPDIKVRVTLNKANEYVSAPTARSRFNVSGKNITVAVLDTGIDETHPDLDEGTEILERDFTNDESTRDLYGHGTHVAGIITGDGEASNGKYVGVAPKARLMDIQVLNNDGYGRISWILDGMGFAIEQNADIISMSLGAPASVSRMNSVFTPIINNATKEGTLVVVAAGNSGPAFGTITTPAIVKKALSVGATGVNGTSVAEYSSRGPTPVGLFVKPDLVAPGTEITSTASSAAFDSQYVTFSGTSMATPVVSGIAALLLDAKPKLSPLEVKHTL
ncbi:MAG: S8 family peptidase, partial [Halobacteriaceae archaeon]